MTRSNFRYEEQLKGGVGGNFLQIVSYGARSRNRREQSKRDRITVTDDRLRQIDAEDPRGNDD